MCFLSLAMCAISLMHMRVRVRVHVRVRVCVCVCACVCVRARVLSLSLAHALSLSCARTLSPPLPPAPCARKSTWAKTFFSCASLPWANLFHSIHEENFIERLIESLSLSSTSSSLLFKKMHLSLNSSLLSFSPISRSFPLNSWVKFCCGTHRQSLSLSFLRFIHPYALEKHLG